MIISKQNPLIKDIKSLSMKKFRDNLGLFVVEGIKPVKEAISLNMPIYAVVVNEKGADIIPDGSYRKEIVTNEVFDYISEEKTPQGVLAILYKKENKLIKSKGRCLLLDGVSDPANVGAIIRTACASGFNDIYMTDDCADAYSQKSVRASMSCVFRVNIMRFSVDEILSSIDKPIYVADMNGEDVFSVTPEKEFCLVIGNEGKGVSEKVRNKSTHTISIKMDNGVESLNASVSAGILMYALKR